MTMRLKSPVVRRSTALAASAAVTLAIGLGATSVSTADAAGNGQQDDSDASAVDQDKGFYDARSGGTAAAEQAQQRKAALASARPATERLRASLGTQAIVDMDGLTGTARQVAKLNGYLTRASSRPASKVAMGYARQHLAALGLKRSDLGTLHLRRDYVDVVGTHHLSWVQSAAGIEVFGNGLQAAVTRDGRLLSIGGSPLTGLTAPDTRATAIPSAKAAIAAVRKDVAEPAAAGPDDSAQRVLFATPSGVRLGWQAITMSADRPMLSVVDAADGRVLYRSDLSSHAHSAPPVRTRPAWKASPAATPAAKPAGTPAAKPKPKQAGGLAFEYFPGHKPGGKAKQVNFTKPGWLKANAKILSGNNSHTYSDINDDDKPNKNEEVKAKSPRKWNYKLQPFHLKGHGFDQFCDNPYPCSWNPNKPYSWRVNRAQNATQVFFFVNNWHDHLMRAPIGFNEAAGNFQKVNYSGKGKGKDPVDTQTIDGANTDNGLPDANHIDNANMATPPDGHSPRMQMFLQHAPFTSYPDGDPWSPTNVGDEADTVYHEYTHGLSNRLVVDAAGRSTLGEVQAGAMGEAWSDWYAMDYLVAKKLQKDKPDVADVVMFQYDGEGVFFDRTEPMDCKVGKMAQRCPGGSTGHTGGYTYADYGKVGGAPEVHTDGEIWAQTIWDLRDKLGSRVSEALVTRAMELSPANPSFLDMRNSILLADMSAYTGSHQKAIWKVFANRGMGYFAGSLDGNDIAPGASFELPPTGNAVGAIEGTVTDSVTGDPIEGAVVTVAFQGSPFLTNPSATTAADGSYSIGPVPQGVYPKVTLSSPGYDVVNEQVTVDSQFVTVNASLDRDWAAHAGGARITDVVGDNLGQPCAPRNAIDQSDAFGWSTRSNLVNGQAGPNTPSSITITLPEAIDITEVRINPTAICGDGFSASTGRYTLEVSTDGVDFDEVSTGDFAFGDLGKATSLNPTVPDGVIALRYTIESPIVLIDTTQYGDDACNSGGAFSGCDWEDVTEVGVYGSPTS